MKKGTLAQVLGMGDQEDDSEISYQPCSGDIDEVSCLWEEWLKGKIMAEKICTKGSVKWGFG